MNKRILSILMAALMMVSTFTACSSSDEKPSDGSSSVSQSETMEEESESSEPEKEQETESSSSKTEAVLPVKRSLTAAPPKQQNLAAVLPAFRLRQAVPRFR